MAQLGGWGPERRLRLVVASTDPARLPGHSSWYLLTNLARPAGRRAQQANLAEVVRLYGLRNWVEQGYKQVKGELGWADFQVRSDRAIRRHWTLVCCAFSFCWQARRRVKEIGRLPGEHCCLSLVWAVLDRASKGWRGLTMTPKALRRRQDLRRELLAEPPGHHGNEEVVAETVTAAA